MLMLFYYFAQSTLEARAQRIHNEDERVTVYIYR